MSEFNLDNKYKSNTVSLTNLNRGINVKDVGLVGDGTTNDATLLNTYLTSIGATKIDLVFSSGTYLISTNVTFPSTVNLVFIHGGVLKVSNGVNITGTSNSIDAGLFQIFDLSLGGGVIGTWNVKEFKTEWMGGTKNPISAMLGRKPNDTHTIAQAYPEVTLATVQALDATATLSDSASWFYLQSYFKTHTKNYWITDLKSNKLAPPQGVYSLSKTLNLSNLGNVHISMYGIQLNPFGSFNGYLVTLDSGYTHTYIDGLFLRGMWKCNGLKLDMVQHYGFKDLVIEFCYTGMSLSRTYYGDFSGECIIGNCMTSVLFDMVDTVTTDAEEVNTIDFSNLDITGALTNDFTQFGKVQGVDKVYGFHVKARTLGIKLAVTIENVDIAVFIDDSLAYSSAKLSIINCYFEAIREWVVYQSVTSASSSAICDIRSSLFNLASPYNMIRLVQGKFTVLDNKVNFADYTVQIDSHNTYRPLILTTDIHKKNIINNTTCPSTRIFFTTEVSDTTLWDVYSYSDTASGFANNPPATKVIEPTMQDNIGYISYHDQPADIPHNKAMFKSIHSPSTKDLTFIDSSKGIVLKDRTNSNYYRLVMDNGVLSVEQEKSSKIFNPVDYKSPLFFANCTDYATFSEKYYGEDLGFFKIKAVSNVWCSFINVGLNDYRRCIGTGAEFALVTDMPSGTWSFNVFNKDIKLYYLWESTYWGLGISSGSGLNARSQKRAVGTTAQRPTGMATGFIYWDTTTSTYVKWDGSAWVTHTP